MEGVLANAFIFALVGLLRLDKLLHR